MNLIAHLTRLEMPQVIMAFVIGFGYGAAILWALAGYLRRRG